MSRIFIAVTMFMLSLITPASAGTKITISDLSEKQLVTLSIAEAKFAKTPMLVKVAFCESSLEHTDDNGSVKRGEVDQRDTGLMQINTKYHLQDSLKLGLDITNIYDNMTYALFLEKHQGLRPWSASRDCWENLSLPALRISNAS